MKVISFGTGQRIFDEESAVGQRQVEYGKIFDELHMVVFSPDGKTEERKLSENVYLYPSNTRIRIFYFLDFFRLAKKIIKKIGKENLVLSAQDPFETGIVGVLLKMFYKVPLQIQLHTDFNNKYFLLSGPLNFIRFFLAHLTLPYADAVRVVSERSKEGIRDLNQNITVLPINVERTPRIKEEIERNKNNSQTILTVARLEKEKDVRTALEAFAQVSSKYPEATFTIAGEGSEKQELQSLANSLGLGEKVSFLGWVSDLPQLYSAHSIYISASLFEGYGMSIVEAGQNGCALVLSDAGVAGEIFKDGESAFVSKPKDVGGFANSLDKLLGDENLRREMGERAKSSALSHIIPNAEYVTKYKEAMDFSFKNLKKRNYISAIFAGNKILRFIVAGGTAALTQILALYFFTSVLGIFYLYSSILSFFIALAISFTLQKAWAFQDKGMKTAHVQFFKYFLVALTGVLVNTAMMYFWVTIIGIWYILAQIITGFFIAVFNFFMYRRFIFTKE